MLQQTLHPAWRSYDLSAIVDIDLCNGEIDAIIVASNYWGVLVRRYLGACNNLAPLAWTSLCAAGQA